MYCTRKFAPNVILRSFTKDLVNNKSIIFKNNIPETLALNGLYTLSLLFSTVNAYLYPLSVLIASSLSPVLSLHISELWSLFVADDVLAINDRSFPPAYFKEILWKQK